MKRVFGAIIGVLLSVVLVGTPSVVFAQGTDSTATAGAGECDSWFVAPVTCLLDPITKGVAGSLNKQVGDIGTATFSMGQMVIAGMGLCDSECNPNCPKGVSYQHSAVAGLSTTALAMYQNPPAETKTYIADVGQTLGFMPKKAQAQGIGFSGLAALLELWKSFRNIAYALLAVILIVVGFMVMFRKKIDPKTVVTVQNAIPRIVIALLLVTFSYAIVGVMIDLMYLAIVMIVSIVSGAAGPALGQSVSLFTTGGSCVGSGTGAVEIGAGTATTEKVASVLFNGGVGGLMQFFMGSGFQAWDDIAAMLTGGFDPKTTAAYFIVPGLIGALVGGGKGLFTGLVSAPILLTLIILIVLIFGFIRLVFMLIDAYINIIISLLTAPFHLMMEAVPGTNAFANWFKNLLSKIIVFPITAVLLLVAAILTSQNVATSIWAPPMLSTGGGTFGMAGIIGLGMLLVIPTVVGGIQKGLKAEPLVPGGVGPIFGPLGSGVGQLFSLVYQASFVSSALRHKPDDRSGMQIAREGASKGLGAITGAGGGGH